jgi:hypothetical protein
MHRRLHRYSSMCAFERDQRRIGRNVMQRRVDRSAASCLPVM